MQWVVNRTASLVRIRCHNQSSIEKSRKIIEFYDSMNLNAGQNSQVNFKVEEDKASPWGK